MNTLRIRLILSVSITFLFFLSNPLFSDELFNDFATKIYMKDIDGVKELLASGIDINMREETMGSTPLMVACSLEGTEKIIELLISYGADVNIQGSYDGRTALIWAASNSKKSVELLIAEGADVRVKGIDGMTAFIQSIFGILSGSVTTSLSDLLLEKGADINAQITSADASGWTALMFASVNENVELVEYLISRGANSALEAKDSTTALSLTLEHNNNDEIIKMLEESQ